MSRAAARITNVEDALHFARRRVPPGLMQAFENGAGSLRTHDANIRALESVMFRPRHGTYVSLRDQSTTVLGHALKTPLYACPIGAMGAAHPDGEVGVARAIGDAGGIQFVSGVCSATIEEIIAVATGPVYFQLYYFDGGRERMEQTIERVRAAGATGLVFVIDSVIGHTPPRALAPGTRRFVPTSARAKDALRFAPQVATRPAWLLDYLRGRLSTQIPMALGSEGRQLSFAQAQMGIYSRWSDWNDLQWIRDVWDCPVVVKGALSVDSARRAVDAGAAGIVVSNHGGNRLDGTIPALPMLPQVVDAVGDQVDVLYDSGIRTGTDVVRALALGAKAVGLGRAYLYPLIAAGEAGVRRILEIFQRDIDHTLAYLGCSSLEELTPEHLALPPADRWLADAVATPDL